MKRLILPALVLGTLFLLCLSPPLLAQGFSQTPDGQTVFIPQPQHVPARPYYAPEGGPPLGTVIEHNGVQTYVPNNLPRSNNGSPQ